jgi:hypothetical protein
MNPRRGTWRQVCQAHLRATFRDHVGEVEHYISEADQADGYWWWKQFRSLAELTEEFKAVLGVVELVDDDPTGKAR